MSNEPRILKFQGNGDDTFGLINDIGLDHDNCASMEPIVFGLAGPDGASMFVWGQYAPGDSECWMIGIQPGEDGKPYFKSWFEPGHDYSPTLCVEVPAGTTIALHGAEEAHDADMS